MPIAYSYIRFSTIEQGKGDSLRRQEELSEAYAVQHDLTIDRTLNLHDLGVSAYAGRNREEGRLGAFLHAVDDGRIAPGSYLLVESLDRLSRQRVYAAMNLFTSILDRGITIVTLMDGHVYSQETVSDNPMKLMLSLLMMMRAHEESETKSHRIKAAWNAKRKNIATKKLTRQCPRWMKLNDERTAFTLITERVEIVLTIVRWSKEGMGQAQIAKLLNEQGIPGFSGQGASWQSSYVNKILTSPALFGQMQPKLWEKGLRTPEGSAVEGYYPAIVTEDEFKVLQGIRANRRVGGAKARKGRDMPNLFSGLVKCGYCGSSMVLATRPGPRGATSQTHGINRPSTKYLVCDGARRGLGCYAVQWNYKDFETSFLAFCTGLDLAGLLEQIHGTGAVQAKRQTLDDQLHVAKKELEAKNTAMDNFLRVLAIDSTSAPASLMQRVRHLQSEVDAVQDRIRQIEQDMSALDRQSRPVDEQLDMFRDFAVKLETLTEGELFRVRVAMSEQIRNIIRKIEVYPAGQLTDKNKIDLFRDTMLQSGESEERISSYIESTLRTEPKRQGRGGRGRYQSVADVGRNFAIYTHAAQLRLIYPEFNNPFNLTVDFGWNDIGGGDYLHSSESDI